MRKGPRRYGPEREWASIEFSDVCPAIAQLMRLCLIAPIVLTSEGGTFRVNGNYGRLIGELAGRFEFIDVVAGQARPTDRTYYPLGKSLYTYPLPSGNVRATLVAVSTPGMSPFQKGWVWLRRIVPFYRALRRADLVYLAMPGFSGFTAFVICRLLRRPYFLYYASEWQSLAPFLARWGRGTSWILAFYRRLAGWAETVPIHHSLFTLAAGSYLQERLHGHGPRVLAANPMVSLQRSDFSEREDTCQSLPITILYVGSLIRRKGVHVLVRALADLEKRGLDPRLVLVGPGDEDYRDVLHEEARSLGVESKVSFEGYVTEWDRLLRLYRAADVFALATESEGFPRVLYEAMSQGLPVVATSIPAIAQSLTAGREALLVPPGSAQAMADGIERLVQDPGLRRSLIADGRSFAQSRLTSRTTARQILELLEEAFPAWKLSGRLEG